MSMLFINSAIKKQTDIETYSHPEAPEAFDEDISSKRLNQRALVAVAGLLEELNHQSLAVDTDDPDPRQTLPATVERMTIKRIAAKRLGARRYRLID